MTVPKTIKLFLASSQELEADRREFELFLSRKNNILIKQGLYIELVIWEDFLDCMSQTRLQDEYNKAVKECDLFVMLFCTKVGKFTLEEFETAFGQFKETNKPLIYTYFKEDNIKTTEINRFDVISLLDFQDRLKELGHFWTTYETTDSLKHQFEQKLEKLKHETDLFQSDSSVNPSITQPQSPEAGEASTANSETQSTLKQANILFPTISKPDEFTGRKELLETIHSRLMESHVPLLLQGMRGIGKTMVARAYFHEARFVSDYDQLAWVTVSDHLRADLTRVLGKVLAIEPEKSSPMEERFQEVIQKLQQVPGKNRLLVIDNANNSDDLIEVKEALKSTNWKILITTIRTPREYKPLPITPLEESEQEQLFSLHYSPMTIDSKDSLSQLLTLTSGHTLLIELLAKAGKTKGLTVTEMVERVEKDGWGTADLQRKISAGDHGISNQENRETTLQRYISSLFEPEMMEPGTQEILRYFSLLSAEPIAANQLKQLFSVQPERHNEFEDNLERLHQEGWLSKQQNEGPGCYGMHSLVQDVVLKKLSVELQSVEPLVMALKTSMEGDLDDSCGYLASARSVMIKLEPFVKKAVRPCSDQPETGLFEAEKSSRDTVNNMALLYFNLFDIYKDLGRLDESLASMEQAQWIFQQTGNTFNLALTYDKIGDLHQISEKHEQALNCHLLQNDLLRDLDEEDPDNEKILNQLAISCSRLGDLFLKMEEGDEARKFYEERIQLAKKLYKGNPRNENLKNGLAMAYEKRGVIHLLDQDYTKALNAFKQTNGLLLELCRSNPGNEMFQYNLVVSHSRLGNAYRKLGNLKKAEKCFGSELKLMQALYDANPKKVQWSNGLLGTWLNLADICRQLGKHKQADKFLKLANEFWGKRK